MMLKGVPEILDAFPLDIHLNKKVNFMGVMSGNQTKTSIENTYEEILLSVIAVQ